jgi:hypothetical protein
LSDRKRPDYFLSDEEDDPDDELAGVDELDVDLELSEEPEEEADLESLPLESPDFESLPLESPLLEPPSFFDPFEDDAGPAPLPRA